MRTRTVMFCALALGLAACPPPGEEVDAGPADAAASDLGGSDAGAVDRAQSDRSGADDVATDDDAAAPDAAGTDAGACTPPVFDACDGIGPSGNSYTLSTSGLGVGGARAFAIGDDRATVAAAMSGLVETPASFNALAVIYCSEGLVLYFADNLGAASPDDEGVLSDDDPLYKITAFGSFDGATDTATPLSLGDDAATVTGALGAADYTGTGFSVSGEPGEFRFFYSGSSALLSGGVVSALSLFAPQSPTDTIDAAVDLAAGTVGGASAAHHFVAVLPVADGSTITEVRAAFGATPDADGDTSIAAGTGSLDVVVLSYSALGVRFVGPAEQYAGMPPDPVTGDDRRIYTIALTAPFQGRDSGVGIGSARADVEALLGQPYDSQTDADGLTLYKYDAGSRQAGVVYAVDSDCVERVAVIFVNLIDADR